MLTFQEFLVEGNPLARIQKHSDTGRHFVAVSAARGTMSNNANKKRHVALKNAVKKMGYGYREAEGRWEGGKEKSLVVHAKHPGDDHGKALAKDMSRLSKHFSQDAYMHHDSKKRHLVGTNKTGYPGRGKKETVGKLAYNKKDAEFQTELRPGKKKSPARFTTTPVEESLRISEAEYTTLFLEFVNTQEQPTNIFASRRWRKEMQEFFDSCLNDYGVIIST
jgi:hypothetical protein